MKPCLNIFLLLVFTGIGHLSFSQAAGDYRSAATGNWNAITTWERYNGTAWVAATATPTSADGVITIQNPHTVTITANVTIDQVVVNTGPFTYLQTSGTVTVTYNDGPGVDLIINGSYWENGTTANAVFSGAATWQCGASAIFRKSSSGSSNVWQAAYQGGISTIPGGAMWHIYKNSATNPAISTIGAYYPNFYISNYSGTPWTTGIGSSFSGTTGYPTIKSTFYIGYLGNSTVNFLNDHTNATPTLVGGNLIVGTGSTIRNYGTGINMNGAASVSTYLQCDGTIIYDANDARTLTFSGAFPHSINNAAGVLNIYNLTINKSANNLTLNMPVTVDNLLTLTNGQIISTTANMLNLNNNATVTGASNASYVNGPVTKYGLAAFTFPVGKSGNYQAISIGAAASGTIFYSETFGTGCNTGLLASTYGWTVAATGTNEAFANQWYVSAEENGNAVGACGTGCGTNRTLHLGSTFSGDIGAAYFESDAFSCGFFGWCAITNRRVQSPTINCTGRSNILLNFKYMEAGDLSFDNATLWYFDGTAWSQLSDPAKTALGCSPQGTWTAYSIALPRSANNNPNVRIGFNWTNNGDGIASDPSFAADDITLTCDAFTAEYFAGNPQTTYNNVLVPALNHISQCEYWVLDRTNGTTNRTVTLTWDAASCGVTLLSDLRVARWDGATWQNEGNTGTTGNTAAGTVSSVTVTNFSPFTLASVSPQNPLPVSLLSFDAAYTGEVVELNWTVAGQVNNDYFTVERTADGMAFTEIATVDGAGNSSFTLKYSATDADPLSGISYYRLKQTDFDGKFSYSGLVPVSIDQESTLQIIAVQNSEAGLDVFVGASCGCVLNIELVDVTGRLVHVQKIKATEAQTKVTFSPGQLSQGMYTLKISDGKKAVTKKLIL
ncbi:MAG: T9SS type A sorting domain-containing protein [Bacteroidota bacterium]